MTPKEKQAAGMEKIREVYEDGFAEINGRTYNFQKMQHVERRKVFAYQSSIAQQLTAGNFAFLDTPGFAQVEEVMWRNVTFDGHALIKLRDHWEEYAEDYMMLISTAMGVMSYPFMRAAGIASASQDESQKLNTSSKPM